jgi:hypothetical protein
VIEGTQVVTDYCLKVNRNIYGSCDASRNWYVYLTNRLQEIGFECLKVDECVFYKGRVLYILYTDDSILATPTQDEIDNAVNEMKGICLNVTDEGTLSDFVGVNITRNDNGMITLSQPKLIEQILSDMRLTENNVKTKNIPMKSTDILRRHQDSEPFDENFHYRSIIGKLNYLEKGS